MLTMENSPSQMAYFLGSNFFNRKNSLLARLRHKTVKYLVTHMMLGLLAGRGEEWGPSYTGGITLTL